MYIARQPIFNRFQKVYGYELLYRDSINSISYHSSSSNSSTATVLSGLFELNLNDLTEGCWAFVNVDEDILMSEVLELIDPHIIVIELLETIQISEAVIQRIATLKDKGYRFALDDFNQELKDYPLLPYVDIIKFDVLVNPDRSIKEQIIIAKKHRILVLAEKVETQVQYEEAKNLGFDFFQGYFFSKPKIAGNLKSKSSNLNTYFQIFRELAEEEPSLIEIADIIKTDAKLAYRLLRVIGQQSVQSSTLIHALLRIGLDSFRRWIYLLMLQELSENKPSELFKIALQRARFGELISELIGYSKSNEISLMCLFSVIDAIMDVTMEDALNQIRLHEDVHQALVSHQGPLYSMLHFVCTYETIEPIYLVNYVESLSISFKDVSSSYLSSIRYAENLLLQLNT